MSKTLVYGNPTCSLLNKDGIFIQPRAISFLFAAIVVFVVDFFFIIRGIVIVICLSFSVPNFL